MRCQGISFCFGLNFQLLSEGFGMFEVFAVRSTFVYSTKIFEKFVSVKAGTTKLINNRVAFRLKSFFKGHMTFAYVLFKSLLT